ncbi:class II aldolase/adducin family protein [Christensenellaceae bacterium OttesenSCG-928-L17]|nr:class II aldolase/adducin family protein [Christensenellaceae bacterium OttesenSCG-928-L17]
MIHQQKQEIVQVSQRAYANKLFAGTSGNLSLRASGGTILITPTSIPYETMEARDIVKIDMQGNVLDGPHKPSSEWRLHAEIYKRCPDVNCVFHTHSPYATAFAVVRQGIPLILVEMFPFLGGDIPCVPFSMPGTPAVGEGAAEAIAAGRNGCLLASHGTVVVGKNAAEAYIRAEYLEEAAMIYHHALQVGDPHAIQF